MRKLERTSQLHCRFLRQRLSTLSCHSYYVHLILRHSVREGTSLNHAFRLNSQTHSQSAQVTCHITDGNPNKEGRDNVPEGPACRPHQRHIGYNHRGRWCVCVCVRACVWQSLGAVHQRRTVWVKERDPCIQTAFISVIFTLEQHCCFFHSS